MMKEWIKSKAEELLAKEYYCTLEDLNQKRRVYTINPAASQPYLKIMTYKNCIAVCTSEDLHEKIQELLQDKCRDEIFELPFVYGQTIHYLPDSTFTDEKRPAPQWTCTYFTDQEISSLQGLEGFENALAFEKDGSTPTKAVYIAEDQKGIIGAAGAAKSSVPGLWEIGVEVSEEYRNAGLGTHLVKGLTRELLSRRIVPFYSASVTNLGSQMVAARCGYIPAWVDTYGTILDGSSIYGEYVKDMSARFL